MLSFEEKFRLKYPDCRVEIENVSSSFDRFHVFVGSIHCGDSGMRDNAFRWVLEDIAAGKLSIPAGVEQMRLF